jgi:hypothetical protein
MDASKAFKKSRTTIYEAIKSGELSRDNDGLIDLSELIRVYGNPTGVQSNTRTEHVQKAVHEHIPSEIENVLKDQISLLKNQLDLANQREKSLMQHIEDLTHRIEFKGVLEPSESPQKDSAINMTSEPVTQIKKEDSVDLSKQIEPMKPTPNITTEPKKRGLFGRVLHAVLSDD